MKQSPISVDQVARFFESEVFEISTLNHQIEQSDTIFLENRLAIENDPYFQTIEGYCKSFELLREYGLEENIICEMKPYLEWLATNKINYLLSSSFYKEFSSHQIVVDIVSSLVSKNEYKTRHTLPS
jgi:hypothetical protein